MPEGILDSSSGAMVAMSEDHHDIHDGWGYVLNGNTASIAAGSAEHISFRTPVASKAIIHFRAPSVASTANSLSVTMTDGAIMSNCTAATPLNCNRLLKDASSVIVTTAATLTSAGAKILFLAAAGSGAPSNQVGGSIAGHNERVLKPDTMYSITFTNIGSTTATVAYYQLSWYEGA